MVNGTLVALIPYQNVHGACDVFITPLTPPSNTDCSSRVAQALEALRRFTGYPEASDILHHCYACEATRILLPVPDNPGEWVWYDIVTLLTSGQLVVV